MKNRDRNLKIGLVLLGLFGVLIYLYFTINHINSISQIVKDQNYLYLSEVTIQEANTVKARIDGNIKTLKSMAGFISEDEEFEINNVLPILQQEVDNKGFKEMGIAFPNGIIHTTGEQGGGFLDQEYFRKAMEGASNLYTNLTDKTDGLTVNVYSTPIYRDDSIVAVLFSTVDTKEYRKILSLGEFSGKGYFYIMAANGDLILGSDNKNSVKNFSNVWDALSKANFSDSGALTEFKNRVKSGDSGQLQYELNGTVKYMNYEPIGINQWYIISVVPEYVMTEKPNFLVKSAILSASTGIGLFVSMMTFIVFIQARSKKALEKIAFVDEITGYSNLYKFELDSRALIEKTHNSKYAMVIFDIDKFKIINDLFGFQKGNETLCEIAWIIGRRMSNKETFTRASADNFYCLIQYKKEFDITDRIQSFLERTNGGEKEYKLNFFFGICKVDDPNTEIKTLIDRADLAKRSVKGRHDIHYAFYSETIRNRIIEEKEIENEMESALKNKEFKLYLQPKILFEDGSVTGAEALVRWEHPKRGTIYPDQFIPLFEKNGFIKKLDFYMFEEVCDFKNRWKSNNGTEILISVNLSRLHLNNPQLVNTIVAITKKYQVEARGIEIEITEGTIFDNIEYMINVIAELKNKEFYVSMDDFGSGYSSLNVLKDLAVDILKIDKVFLNEAVDSNRGKKIILNIINMAKDLDLITVAEGVETKEQVDFLKEVGCDIAQGYFFARPMPADEFEKFFKNERAVF